MKKIFIVSFILMLALASKGFAGDTVRLTEHIDEHGKRTVYNTTKAILEKCPSWKLDKEPPFPIYKAVAISEQWIKEKYPKFTNVRIVYISISPIGDPKFKDKWYYSIAAQAGVDLDGVSASSYFSVMVLFDGTVVGPSTPRNDEKAEEDCQQKNRGYQE